MAAATKTRTANGPWAGKNRAETKKAYDREWRRRNPNYHREYNRRYKSL